MEKSKAVVLKKFGGYEGISVEDFPLPPLQDNFIEVKVKYGGLNFADLYIRQGFMRQQDPPFVLGMECVGTVTAVGSGVTTFAVDDRVICYDVKGGLHREIIRIPSDKCYPLPSFVSWEDAGSLLVQYLTAYFAVLHLGALRPGESVLILSCAGGVGWAATQFAKTVEDVKVYGTVSKGKENLVKENGVDDIFYYENLKDQLKSSKGFDLIITNVSGDILDTFQSVLKPLGRLIIIGASNLIKKETKISYVDLIKLWWKTRDIKPVDLIMNNRVVAGLHLAALIEKDNAAVLKAWEKVLKYLEQGKIKPRIHATWPIDDIIDATKELAERKNVGKVLIAM